MAAHRHILDAERLDEASCDVQVNPEGIYGEGLCNILKKYELIGSPGCTKRRVLVTSGRLDAAKSSSMGSLGPEEVNWQPLPSVAMTVIV